MLDTSSRASVRAAEKAAERASRARGEVLINLMSTAPGREWVWSFLELCHVFHTSFSEPGRMAFLEGERNIGIILLNDVMRWCPDSYIEAMREANGRRTAGDADPASKRPLFEDGDGGDQGLDDEDRLKSGGVHWVKDFGN